ncbi:DUF221-domain-containing protein [Rhizodiscina lignyota]|uniref:DUF221-domain-containing protein n=1 Tax=Rhizodiscina lignyota TaxID=1504668 RepID=A0A9P4IGT4_9PEZI|nr:DUF221-domain-containing protein [Rhizodiscina lignyota]
MGDASNMWSSSFGPGIWANKDEDKPPPGSGGHRSEGSTSLEAILATFIPTFLTAVITLLIFLQLRGRYPNIYSPRTYFGGVPKKDRTPQQGLGRYDWLNSFRTLDDRFILRHQSIDAYLWCRFLKTMIFVCFVGCCITWPVLFPVNATGGGDSTELDRISFSNVTGKKRLYAHAAVAWVFLGFVMFTVAREKVFLRELRQAYYLSKPVSERLSSRTVLYMHPSNKTITDDDLERVYSEGARKHWVVTDVSDLQNLVDSRNSNAMALEAAQVSLIRQIHKKELNSHGGELDIRNAEKQVRPSHRLFPLFGQKVDAITWFRDNATSDAKKLEDGRNGVSNSNTASGGQTAIFVEYATQAAARKAYHHLSFGRPLQLEPRFIGLQPKEVLWQNVGQGQTKRLSKKSAATALAVLMIIFWSIPVGIIGTISNLNYLTDKVPFLRFMDDLPGWLQGLITGLLPPTILSWLVSYVPKFFRKLARRFEPTIPQAEKLTQAWYFAFQLIQVFLVTTFTSGAAAVATQIAREPGMVPALLAENLPKASNFYLTYFILQGTASAAQNVLNWSDLAQYIAYDRLIDRTPRAKYERYTWMKGISWGTVYPKFANFAVIAIAYSCIAPLTLGFAAIGIYFYYLSYRYNLLFVIQTKIDTKGDAYATAFQHIFTGVYLSELCLIGLFSVRKAPGPSIMMVVLLILTILYHVTLNRLLKPIERLLPPHLRQEDEEAPLVDGDEYTADVHPDQGTTQASNIKRRAPGWIPSAVFDVLERLLLPDVNSHRVLKTWFEDPDALDEAHPNEDQLANAYVNPVLTSKMPKLWLVRDSAEISKREIDENEKAGISTTDEGAELDNKNHVVWDRRNGGSDIPIFKETVKY